MSGNLERRCMSPSRSSQPNFSYTMRGDTVNPWVVRLKRNPQARLRLFCFPYAGGGAHIFRGWPEHLPPFLEVCAVQPPGRGSRMRERPFTSLMPLVREAAEALLPCLDLPFAFFGHSLGAKIEFELARYLRRVHHRKARHLFVSGCRAPQIKEPVDITYNLPENEFIKELSNLNGTPREVLEHSELLQLILPMLRADFEIVQTYAYIPEPPLDCPITACGGLADAETTEEHIEAWREQTTSSFVMQMFPGDHFFLQTRRQELLRFLSMHIER